jgi:L-ascorbate metabolism protein UlaG (beta-lactamase superfamily)
MKRSGLLVLLAFLAIQSCVTLKPGTISLSEPEGIRAGNCMISSTGVVYVNLFGIKKANFLPNSIKIEHTGLNIYIDPFRVQDSGRADYIFITHNHFDHFSKTCIKAISKPGTLIIAPECVSKKLKDYDVRTVYPGDKGESGNISYEAIPSYNIISNMHKRKFNYTGFVISCDTVRIYIAGDTDLVPEMRDLKDITVAILPIGVGKTAMDPLKAAEAANIIKPRIVIPCHFNLGEGNESLFSKNLDRNIILRYF